MYRYKEICNKALLMVPNKCVEALFNLCCMADVHLMHIKSP